MDGLALGVLEEIVFLRELAEEVLYNGQGGVNFRQVQNLRHFPPLKHALLVAALCTED